MKITNNKPKFQKGDTLVWYIFWEKEKCGKILGVDFDKSVKDWYYLFDDDMYVYESDLLYRNAHIK